jgi:hypothetical protein
MAKQLFSKPLPKVVYRYLDFSNKFHLRVLTKHELYLSKPSQFNDPFEGQNRMRSDFMKTEDDKINAIHRITNQGKKKTFESWRIANSVYEGLKDKIAGPIQMESKESIQKRNNLIGLYCLSTKPDDILMWSHYAKYHTGFVVGFETEALMARNDFDFIDHVNYFDDYPVILPGDSLNDTFVKKFFSKSSKWSYENEVRISKNHIKNRKYNFDPSVIVEVYAGCRMADTEFIKLKRFITKYIGKEIPVKRFAIDVDRYGLRDFE